VLINKGNGEKLPIDTGATTSPSPAAGVDEAFDVEIDTQPTGASRTWPTTQRQRLHRVLRRVTCASNPTRWAAPSKA
jgi:hypothetical protein